MRRWPFVLALAPTLAFAAGDPDAWFRAETKFLVHVDDRYRNENWGYEIALPRGIGGWMTDAPNPNHGVEIILGPHRTIQVSAEADSLEFNGTTALLDEMLEPDDTARHAGARRVERRVIGLGGLPAEEAIVRQEDAREVMVAQWIGPPEGPMNDQLWLTTDAAHEAVDTASFALVVASFRHFARR